MWPDKPVNPGGIPPRDPAYEPELEQECSTCGSTDPQHHPLHGDCPDPFHPPQPPDGELHIDDDSELMEATREALDESAQPPEGEAARIARAKQSGYEYGRSIAQARIDSLTTGQLTADERARVIEAVHQTIELVGPAFEDDEIFRKLALTPDDSGSEHQEGEDAQSG